jgi:ribonuclease P protein component
LNRKCSIHRFGRPQRLLKAIEFKRVFEQPFKSTDAYFIVLARPSLLAKARLGIAIAKKNVRTAVQRNRIKRLIRESFRQHLPDLQPFDYVVLARERIECLNNQTLLHSLEKHWQRLIRPYKQ